MEESPEPGSPATSTKRKITLVEVLVVLAIVTILIALILPGTHQVRGGARRTHCRNNLKMIGLALYNYLDVYGAFPPAYTVDANGKPLHSWRTLLLPYFDQQALYDHIDLTKSWDDPANAEALQTVIPAYSCPSLDTSKGQTAYLAMVTRGSCLRSGEPRRIADITDERSQTLLVIEVDADHAVPWMAPTDADEELLLSFGPKSKLQHVGGLHALLVDGSTWFLSMNLSATDRRALVSIAGNDKVSEDF